MFAINNLRTARRSAPAAAPRIHLCVYTTVDTHATRRQQSNLTSKTSRTLGAREPGPTQLATDSQSARDVSYNPQHHDRMKHVQRRHFFVRDMVEKFELEVPFVRTHDNLADFLTKAMSKSEQFFKLRAHVMNERVFSAEDHTNDLGRSRGGVRM